MNGNLATQPTSLIIPQFFADQKFRILSAESAGNIYRT